MKYSVYGRKRKRSNKPVFFGLVLGVVLLSLAGALVYIRPSTNTKNAAASDGLSQPAAAYTNVSGSYLFSGTIMLGRDVAKFANGDYNQPFSEMNTLGTYNARIGVLECPVTSANVPYQTQINDLIFNCSPNWLPTLKKYFPIINVSSNHMYDQGASGFAETMSRLNAAGFQIVGNYNPHVDKDDCKPIILPVNLRKPDGRIVEGSLPVAMCSYNYKELFSPAPGEIASIHKWSQIMPVIALMNGGPEYEHTASASQTSNAHQMIDEGADFVVGNGTHWAQNTEVYKGKLIVYSLGNFIFDQLDQDGRLALNLAVSAETPYDNNVDQWLQIGQRCAYNMKNCLAIVNAAHLQRIHLSYMYNPVVSAGGDMAVTQLANIQQQAYINLRANWSQTQAALAQANER